MFIPICKMLIPHIVTKNVIGTANLV